MRIGCLIRHVLGDKTRADHIGLRVSQCVYVEHSNNSESSRFSSATPQHAVVRTIFKQKSSLLIILYSFIEVPYVDSLRENRRSAWYSLVVTK